MKVEVRKIGDSTVVILPEELVARLNLRPGQWLHAQEVPGGVRLTPHDSGEVTTLVDEYRDTLRALAR